MADVLMLHRVSYGRQDTPAAKREYVADFWGSPVGTKPEWRKWAKEHGKTLVFKESKRTVFVNQEAK